jgi:hypothetical protein
MPRFYFHFRKGDEFIIENEGLDLPGGREVLAGSSKRGKQELAYALEVTDESGRFLPRSHLNSPKSWGNLATLYFGEPRPSDISHWWMCIVIVMHA